MGMLSEVMNALEASPSPFRNSMSAVPVSTTCGDLSVVNAARASFAKQQDEVTEKDHGLIRYLAEHEHFTCFTHTRWTMEFPVSAFALHRLRPVHMMGLVFKVLGGYIYVRHSLWGWAQLLRDGIVTDTLCIKAVKSTAVHKAPISSGHLFNVSARESLVPADFSLCDARIVADDPAFKDVTMIEEYPFFIARQRFKHMVGFTYNEVSRRYVKTPAEVYSFPKGLSSRPEGNIKQGAGGIHPDSKTYSEFYKEVVQDSLDLYDNMVAREFAYEQARGLLPMAAFTTVYVTGSLEAWDRMIALRTASGAQAEIREFAHIVQEALHAV